MERNRQLTISRGIDEKSFILFSLFRSLKLISNSEGAEAAKLSPDQLWTFQTVVWV